MVYDLFMSWMVMLSSVSAAPIAILRLIVGDRSIILYGEWLDSSLNSSTDHRPVDMSFLYSSSSPWLMVDR